MTVPSYNSAECIQCMDTSLFKCDTILNQWRFNLTKSGVVGMGANCYVLATSRGGLPERPWNCWMARIRGARSRPAGVTYWE